MEGYIIKMGAGIKRDRGFDYYFIKGLEVVSRRVLSTKIYKLQKIGRGPILTMLLKSHIRYIAILKVLKKIVLELLKVFLYADTTFSSFAKERANDRINFHYFSRVGRYVYTRNY